MDEEDGRPGSRARQSGPLNALKDALLKSLRLLFKSPFQVLTDPNPAFSQPSTINSRASFLARIYPIAGGGKIHENVPGK
jgi:hypothetical protein